MKGIARILRGATRELPPAAWLGVVGAAALGYAGSLSALLAERGGGATLVAAAGALLLAPVFVGPAVLPGPARTRLRRWLAFVVASLQAVLVLDVWTLRDGSVLAAAFCGAQGHALVRSTHAGAATLSLALALAQTSSALRVAPSDAGMLVLIVQIALALVAQVLVHSSAARRLAARNRRLVTTLGEPTLDTAGRTRYALRLAAALAVPSLLLLALGVRLGNGSWLARGPDPQRPRPGNAEPGSPAPDEPQAASDPGLWRDSISFGEGVGRLSEEVVLWARPRAPGDGATLRDLSALRLAVLPLDTFDASGLSNPRLDRARQVDDGDDGELDGWLTLGAASGELFELELLQRPLRIAASVGDVLVRTLPLVALEAPRALHDPDGVLVLPAPSDGWFVYRELCVAPWGQPSIPAGTPGRHPDGRFTQLPPPSPELERVAERSRRLVRGAADDAQRVQRVLDHFADEFSYSLQGSGFVGLPGVLAFLDEREGYCTSFAAASVLLLRTQGIACRAVGGYLAHEWDEQRDAFVVRGRHAHAWIEVHFEGLGWRAFDPTPARARERAFERAARAGPGNLTEWGADLADALRGAVLDDGPSGALGRVGAVLAQAPAMLGESLGSRPLRWGGALAALLALLALVARRRVGRALARVGVRLPGEPPPVSAYERLLALLARHGLAPGPAETLREFSARATARLGVPLELAAATEVHYRARYGGREPSADERAFLEALVARARSALAVAQSST